MKKRIMFSGEASWLSTGFAVMQNEFMRRLHATKKYELAEVGSWGSEKDARASKLPWKFYGVLPTNDAEKEIVARDRAAHFGGYKIEGFLADFQPDIVINFRDPWMMSHDVNNRFASNYKTILIPTVDSAPQKVEWIDDIFKKATVVCAYSYFGKKTLEKQGVPVADVISPGVDLSLFRPLDKDAVRADWGINKNIVVIGTVMRNQSRKLFPELFSAFATLKKRHSKIPEVNKSVLLCHTSWPDSGWDLPELLNRNKIKRDVIFTYKCDACSKVFLQWFLPSSKDGFAQCIFCGANKAHMPNTHSGVDAADLAEIYNLMDVYVHPAICEGWGLPIVEAKACGVPGIYQNYSAMEDHIANGGGLPLSVKKFYTEPNTMAVRSLPDEEDFVKKLLLLVTDKKKRNDLSAAAIKCAQSMHAWDISANKLMSIIDKIKPYDRSKTWDVRPLFKSPVRGRLPANTSADDFIVACYKLILNRQPDTDGIKYWLKEIAAGKSRDDVENYFRREAQIDNRFEEKRYSRSMEIRGMSIEAPTIEFVSDRLSGILK